MARVVLALFGPGRRLPMRSVVAAAELLERDRAKVWPASADAERYVTMLEAAYFTCDDVREMRAWLEWRRITAPDNADAELLMRVRRRRIPWKDIEPVLRKYGMRTSIETIRKLWERRLKEMQALAASLRKQMRA